MCLRSLVVYGELRAMHMKYSFLGAGDLQTGMALTPPPVQSTAPRKAVPPCARRITVHSSPIAERCKPQHQTTITHDNSIPCHCSAQTRTQTKKKKMPHLGAEDDFRPVSLLEPGPNDGVGLVLVLRDQRVPAEQQGVRIGGRKNYRLQHAVLRTEYDPIMTTT